MVNCLPESGCLQLKSAAELEGIVRCVVVLREGAGAGVYGQSVRRRLSFPLGRYTTVFRHRYIVSWHVFMKSNFRTDRRNT
jgi:hypothetical protein